jgi:hypothetical protein
MVEMFMRGVKRRRGSTMKKYGIMIAVALILIGCIGWYAVSSKKSVTVGTVKYEYSMGTKCLSAVTEEGEKILFDEDMLAEYVQWMESNYVDEDTKQNGGVLVLSSSGWGYCLLQGESKCYYRDHGQMNTIAVPEENETFQSYVKAVDDLIAAERPVISKKNTFKAEIMIAKIIILREEGCADIDAVLKLCGYSKNDRTLAAEIEAGMEVCQTYLDILNK